MISKDGFKFDGYLISRNLAGEMIYQLKILFNWNCKEAYSFFKSQFTIINSKNELIVNYEAVSLNAL